MTYDRIDRNSPEYRLRAAVAARRNAEFAIDRANRELDRAGQELREAGDIVAELEAQVRGAPNHTEIPPEGNVDRSKGDGRS